MKRLAEVYWGNQNTGSDGTPSPLSIQTPEFRELVRVDVALMRFSPGTGVDGQQQDPSEFLTRYLGACLESVDYGRPENVDWQRQCNALFELDVQLTRTCECQAPRTLAAHAAADEGGIAGVKRLTVLPNGQPDSVKASLRREFGVTENLEYNFHCNACNQDCHHLIEIPRIEAAPALLRLQLNPVRIVQREIEGVMENETVPNYNPIQINEHFDLNECLEP
ncbi:hypothetical protein E8E11_006740 [Didymella keratinophila]|nr:hypothetical protein E8E11_006740 [Didymella keratinophila]